MSKEAAALPATGYLRLRQVLQFIPIGKTSWWEGIRAGRFPAGVKLGPKTTAWRAEDIKRLIENPPPVRKPRRRHS